MIRPFVGLLDPGFGSALARMEGGLLGSRLGGASELSDAGALVVRSAAEFTAHDGVRCMIDGAVYNCEELADELALDRCSIPETVLARGFRRWGAGLAPRLRGEFTIVVWDQRRRCGLLIPDQIGIRRLMLRRDGDRLWFATEVRDLIALLPTRPAPNQLAVSHWLARTAVPGGKTLYEGIDCLEAGEMVELRSDGWQVRRYWRPEYEEPLDLSDGELVDRIKVSLELAVSRRTTPDAPTGVLMSGGLDSTSVAALAHDASPTGACGFSATFPDYPQIDELAWIEQLESHLAMPGVHLAAKGRGIIASSLEYLAEWELPLSAWNEAWTQPLLRRAAEMGVTAMLSGEGGDELFGSRFLLTADLMKRGRLFAAFRYARGLPEAGGRAPRDVLAHVLWKFGVQGLVPAWLEGAWHRAGLWENPAPWWATEATTAFLRESRAQSWRRAGGPRWWAYLTHALTTGVHGFGLFDHVRRRTEQAGLEARHPLFDLDLFTLMLRVPPLMCARGSITRPLFRDAMAGRTPDGVRLRPDKSVFNDLVIDALVGPEFKALELLLGDSSEVRAFARVDGIRELLERRPPNQRGYSFGWAQDVLRLAAIEVWLRFQEDRSLPMRLLEDSLIPKPDFALEVHVPSVA